MPKSRNGARRRSAAQGTTDDLTVIEGIGPARSRWLRSTLDVATYRDLAALSGDDVVAALRSAGQVASPSVVEGWIARAHELVVAAERLEWAPLASFVVEFQGRSGAATLRTVVHHVEGDENETWADIATDAVSRWMLARAPQVAAESPADPPPARRPRPPGGVRIGPLRLLSAGDAAAPAAMPVAGAFARWPRNEPFALEVGLELEPGGATAQGDHRVRLYAESLETATRVHLGDGMVRGSTVPGAAVVGDCRLPEGMYRLSVLVSEGDRLVPTTLVAPLLRVG